MVYYSLRIVRCRLFRRSSPQQCTVRCTKPCGRGSERNHCRKRLPSYSAVWNKRCTLANCSSLAVLIGREPNSDEEREAQRQSELNVTLIIYDEILAVQENKLAERRPYKVLYGSPGYRP